ncbi:MAG: anthranilate synthase component I [Eubacteriales bacterium]|nr:anthranilate synthase component I [Eubacteriales bacterium]
MNRKQITRDMINPSYELFHRFSTSYHLIPLTIRVKADTLTPISLFQRFRTKKDCFLLESAEGNERQARYSIMGRDPLISVQCRGQTINMNMLHSIPDQLIISKDTHSDPIKLIREILQLYKIPSELSTDGYRCGLTGYFAYDFIRYIETIPDNNNDELRLPDCNLMAPAQVVVYDHLKHEMTLIQNIIVDTDSKTNEEQYTQAVNQLESLLNELISLDLENMKINKTGDFSSTEFKIESSGFEANITKEHYMSMVERTKKYIKAGDIFQAVISQRFSTTCSGDSFSVYRSLRNVNPSPYLFYIQNQDACLAGASPEMLVRLTGSKLETCPIAGTRKRGNTVHEDEALAQDLCSDPKEMAEHAMLTDLARNDIGRIAKIGSVKVTEFAKVEHYSHVMHLVSLVEGELSTNKSGIDVLCSLLPAGTLSGAPKIRAMEIIDELENTRRGPYGGAAGYLSFDGSINTCITIRTALITGGKIHVQAGAGIVADSQPESEYVESVNKAAAMIAAIEQAGEYL